jgi:hypothetical protein
VSRRAQQHRSGLGHVIAMWGDPKKEEDHHAWAHDCGVTIVEHPATKPNAPAWMKDLRDAKWRSLETERVDAKPVKPSLEKREKVLALFIALHDRVGPRVIGDAINQLDAKDARLRVDRVRYYTFGELKKALLADLKDADKRKALEELLP